MRVGILHNNVIYNIIKILITTAIILIGFMVTILADDSVDSIPKSDVNGKPSSDQKWGDFNGDGVIDSLDLQYRLYFLSKNISNITIPKSELGRIRLQDRDTTRLNRALTPRLVTFRDNHMPRNETFTNRIRLQVKSVLIENELITITFILEVRGMDDLHIFIGKGSELVDDQGRSLKIQSGPNTQSRRDYYKDKIYEVLLTFATPSDGSDVHFLDKVIINTFEKENRSIEIGMVALPLEWTAAATVKHRSSKSNSGKRITQKNKTAELIQPLQPRLVSFRHRVYYQSNSRGLGIQVESILIERDRIEVNLVINVSKRNGLDIVISNRSELIANNDRRLKLMDAPSMDAVLKYPAIHNQKLKMIFEAPRDGGEIWWFDKLRICDSPRMGLVYEFKQMRVPLKSTSSEIVEIL